MIRRLLEQEFYRNLQPSEAQLDFLMRELRTPELLLELCAGHPLAACRQSRPAVDAAVRGELELTRNLLAKEEQAERDDDALYWSSLRRELELMRFPPKLVYVFGCDHYLQKPIGSFYTGSRF